MWKWFKIENIIASASVMMYFEMFDNLIKCMHIAQTILLCLFIDM